MACNVQHGGLFTALLLLCGTVASLAQQSNLRVERLGVEQGIPMSRIVSVMQDSRGFVWIGGYAGLIRYDGHSVVHYVNNPDDPFTIGDSRVTTIVEAEGGGGLWIGTQHNLNFFDWTTETFTRYFQPQPGDAGASRKYILGLCELSSGHVVLLQESEIGVLSPESHQYRALQTPENAGKYRHLRKGRDGRVWIAADGGLFTINFEKNTIEQAPLSGEAAGAPIFFIAESSDGALWLGSNDKLFRRDRRTGAVDSYRLTGPKNAKVQFVMTARNGGLWCGTDKGLYHFDPLKKHFQYFSHDRNNIYSLSNNGVSSIYEDRTGVVWVSTAAGVNVIKPSTASFRRLPDNYQVEIIPPSQFRSFFEITPGRLLLWEKEGLMVFDRTTGAKYPFPHRPAQLDAWNTGVYCFFKDRQGRIWMGTHGGVFAFDPVAKNFAHYHTGSGGDRALSHDVIRDINEDHDGAIWIATWGGGVNRLDEKAGKVTHFFHEPVHEKTYQNGARRVFVDRSGTVWVGTRGGLHRYNKETGTFKRYAHDPANIESIGENTSFDIFEDENGLLWIGTYGGGLNRFDPRKETFKRFTMKDGLPDNNVFSVLPDDKGHLWLSTYGGVVKFHLETEKILRTLDYRDGLLNQQFDAFSHYKIPSTGELFFEGKHGMDTFHPDSIRPDSTPPVVRFSGFQLFNRSVPIRRDGRRNSSDEYYLDRAISETKKLVIPYRMKVMTFEFAALHFANPAKNQYAYRLEGFDKDWQHIGNRRSVTFTNLRPGQYTLRVKASNADGTWNEEGVAMEIVITPPWWLSWWAFGLYMLTTAALFYAYFQYRRRRWQMQAELATQQREAQRLQELDKFKTQLYANFTHEFRTPLTVILGLADEIPVQHEKQETGRLHKAVEMVRRNSFRLLQIVNQILDLSKLEAGMLRGNMMQADAVALLRYLSDSYQSLADAKNITLTFEAAPAALLMDIDEEKLTTIYSNLLSNAVKFTDEGGSISIKVSKQEGVGAPLLVMEVCDTGIGIPKDKLPHVFERFYQVNDSDNARHGLRLEGGTGIGLTLSKELAELLGGTIEAESEEGRGACFRVQLPVSNKAPLQPEGALFSVAPVPAGRAAARAAEPPLSPDDLPTLLIVEDSPDIITYLRTCLEEQYRILTATNGRRGLETAIEKVPDLIISDVMMPEMDGFQLCETLKNDERTSHIPIVLLTARVDAESRLKGLGRGADAYLGKPFNLEELKLQLANLNSLQQKLRARYQNLTPLPPTEDPALQIEDEFVAKARQAVYNHLDDADFSVEHLMRILGVSRTQLHNKLKALTGRSATGFIRFVRLQHARELLRTTQKTVAEVAYATGFNSPGYFTRRYQEEFGELPGKKK